MRRSPPTDDGDGPDYPRDDLRRRRSAIQILVGAILLPLAAASGFAIARLGRDAREVTATALVARADSAASVLRAVWLGEGGAIGDAPDSLARAAALSFLSDRDDPGRYYGVDSTSRGLVASSMTGARGRLPVAMPAEVMDRLQSLDRSFATTLSRRITAVVPIRDAAAWDAVGVLAAQSASADPVRLPRLALILAVIMLGVTTALGLRFADRSSVSRALPVFLPPAAFAVWLAWQPSPGPPAGGGGHAFWTVVSFAGWAVVASIAASLIRIAERPLELREAAGAWAFIAPSFAHLLVFSIGPILFSLWLSFHQWNLLQPDRPFVGLANYRELAADSEFWHAVRNTALYVLFVPAGMVVALALALLVNRRVPGVRIMRTVFFLPYITSFVAISLVWRWMFQPDVGLFNNLLGRIGVPPQPWLSSPASALPSLMLMSIWMYAGYMMVIFLAGLQNIPESLYESARIDGAGPWQRFRHITLPMLRPTMLFILVTMIIFMFQVFTAVYVMTEGGPLHATDVVVYHVYRAAWEYLRMGYASAMAWVLFAIVFVITLVQFRWLGSRHAQ